MPKECNIKEYFLKAKSGGIFFARFRTSDAQNLVISSFLKELDTGKKFIVSDHVGKAPRPRLPMA